MIAVNGPAPSSPSQLPEVGGSGTALVVPRRSLVLVAGLPGAGKTTLVRRLGDTPGVHALDSEDVAGVLARVPLPYRSVRPLVHLVHLLCLLLTLMTPAGCVLSSDPLTSSRRRAVFAAAAALTGRRMSVVLLHTAAQDARDGQRRRGRVLTEARMSRHEHRYAQQLRAGWLSTADHVLSRDEAERFDISTPMPQPERAPELPQPRTSPTTRRDRDTRPCRPRRTPHVSAVPLGRHVRPGPLVLAGATLLGLWFGLTAPAVSPILPDAAGAVQPGDGSGGRDGDGPRGRR